ncbi:MAG: hypothetical protein IPL61_20985 [Myxococcales bacterium]|nr:hypothetical protein [Myxococcales bacterium]
MSPAPCAPRRAVALALALAGAGCAHRQHSNRQVASGAIAVLAVIGMIVLLSLQCNELTETCE